MEILIVEDEEKIAHSIKSALDLEGYSAHIASTGEDGLYRLMAEPFDLVILDIMLPGRSGIEILEALRKNQIQTPVVILSAKDTVSDRVRGLDSGADDYLIKPFSLLELKARIRALLRREKPQDSTTLQAGNLKIDLLNRTAVLGNTLMECTFKEFELLEYLIKHQNFVVSRDMLERDVWKSTQRATSLDNVIDVHIMRLRKKLKKAEADVVIETVRGLGFRLHSPSS